MKNVNFQISLKTMKIKLSKQLNNVSNTSKSLVQLTTHKTMFK